ncbi:MAG: glycosyltransferase family 9 protein [Gemmatimonadetes bacterium]|nr:glycosyltransferase family 9 protein [Gemmatimonadota bacterium]
MSGPDHHDATDDERARVLREVGADAILHVFPRREVAAAARDARIPRRIGTARRWFHWLTCTERVNVSRKRSHLHEAQLNLKVAAPLLAGSDLALADLVPHIGLTRTPALAPALATRLATDRTNVLLQPLTGGTVPPWPLERWKALAEALGADRFRFFVTGTADEGRQLAPWLATLPAHVEDATGLGLAELLAFARASDGLVAASTGPLHIAAALGVHALGLYPARSNALLGRWHPLGARAEVITAPEPEVSPATLDIAGIDVPDVAAAVARWAR